MSKGNFIFLKQIMFEEHEDSSDSDESDKKHVQQVSCDQNSRFNQKECDKEATVQVRPMKKTKIDVP